MIKKEDNYYIIGYNIDAVTLARNIADNGGNVFFLNTGKLGYPYDDIGDYVSESTMKTLSKIHPSIEFESMSNSTYAMFDYAQLKMVNSYNGLISYPINKSSFESAEEQEQIEYCVDQLDDMMDTINNSKNYINSYKKFFPRWLYDSCIKHISLNKWHTRQSKLTRYSLQKEINLNYLDEFGTNTIYKPVQLYESICVEMLDHDRITVKSIDVREVSDLIRRRFNNIEVIIMDNRIDHICDYTSGNFERIKLYVDEVPDLLPEEFINVDKGIVFTPMKDHFCAITEYGKNRRIRSEKVTDLSDWDMSIIVPTNDNFRIFKDYEKLMSLYSGKNIDIGSKYNSIII